MRQLGRLFLQGLAATLPLALTVYVLWWLGSAAERGFGGILRASLPEGAYVPGLGVVLGVGVMIAIGIVLRAWWARSVWLGIEGLLGHIPLVKTIYGPVKDLMTFFAEGDRKRQLSQVVMVRIGEPPLQLMGLVTKDDAQEVTGRDADADQIAVYLPMSYQIGGFMVLVPRDAVEYLELSVEDALRAVVTAGLSNSPPAPGGVGP